ncbi:MAG: YggS family pyridoxal phosphate-dependent enzyme [Actinomycetota bacterium]
MTKRPDDLGGATRPDEIRSRVEDLRRRLEQACRSSGRDPDEVRVVAAAKTRSAEQVQAVVDLGITDIGENRVQELVSKRTRVSGATWHLIGPLQSNKVAKVVGKVELIHSIDSVALANKVAERARSLGVVQAVLLEVNISSDPSKHGFEVAASAEAAGEIAAMPGLALRGLMAIPARDDMASERFAELRRIRDELASRGLSLPELSMGMSADLEAAVAEGATLVRPGTALFGPRG